MTKYTLTQPAYDHAAGDTVELDESDPLVQLNVENGILVKGSGGRPARMTCPICAEHLKVAPKFSDRDEVAEHYEKKHPAYAVPDWSADPAEGSE